MKKLLYLIIAVCFIASTGSAQIGKKFPSERKVVKDPVTGSELIFLTSTQGMGDHKIYQTHNQWTADGKWLIFSSSGRAAGEAIAVNEETGEMVQVSEGGYMGMLNIGRKNMVLHFMRAIDAEGKPVGGRRGAGDGRVQIIEVDLAKVFADSKAGKMKEASYYQEICGTTPASIGAGGDMAVDANEDVAYFRVSKEEAARHLPAGAKIEANFGARNMGAGPSGIASMNLKTGEVKHVVSTPFQIGHIQTNPWVSGEIMFCWETGGKAPQRVWMINVGDKEPRPVFAETANDWVTHEAIVTKDEVAIAIMGHRPIGTLGMGVSDTKNPGQEEGWGPSGTRAHAGGLGIVNLRTNEIYIAGQTKSGSGLWHVSGSPDGRFAVGDDFKRDLWLIDRNSNEMMLLTAGHKETASDHIHPTFSPDNTKIQFQSAMLSEDNKSLNICVVKVPQAWLNR